VFWGQPQEKERLAMSLPGFPAFTEQPDSFEEMPDYHRSSGFAAIALFRGSSLI
jgi:hypothetical protein